MPRVIRNLTQFLCATVSASRWGFETESSTIVIAIVHRLLEVCSVITRTVHEVEALSAIGQAVYDVERFQGRVNYRKSLFYV